MDTRFWGPSGWRLLHLVSFAAPSLNQTQLQTFLTHLPYVLPCKFCRASLTDYYAADPIPKDPKDMPQWMYRIHNRVNNKLREQKLLDAHNPKYEEIETRYKEWMDAPCTKRRMVGWDFLFSVAYTTPCPSVTTTPMPDAPPHDSLTTPELRNRWNIMTRAERLPFLSHWWKTLPHILPFPEWRAAWQNNIRTSPSLQKGRKAITAWLYAAEKTMCAALKETTPHDSFQGLCSELSAYASGCGKIKSSRVKTCRGKRKHIEKRRTRKYYATGGFL